MGTYLPNFFDDFYVAFPYLSKIRKTFQQDGVAFFLLNAFAASSDRERSDPSVTELKAMG
jgi:hypothetical protein